MTIIDTASWCLIYQISKRCGSSSGSIGRLAVIAVAAYKSTPVARRDTRSVPDMLRYASAARAGRYAPRIMKMSKLCNYDMAKTSDGRTNPSEVRPLASWFSLIRQYSNRGAVTLRVHRSPGLLASTLEHVADTLSQLGLLLLVRQ